jgi:hypothetical protein
MDKRKVRSVLTVKEAVVFKGWIRFFVGEKSDPERPNQPRNTVHRRHLQRIVDAWKCLFSFGNHRLNCDF